jgi:hypothetical protein
MGLALVHAGGLFPAHCRVKLMHRNRVSLLGLMACSLALAGCATVKSYWPFGHAAVAAPQPVSELELVAPADGTAPVVLQFWERNTLVIDLTGVAASGKAVLARRADQTWPARIALRMLPQRFEAVEVRGAQRVVMPVAATAGAAVTAELPPRAYAADTGSLTITWGPAATF